MIGMSQGPGRGKREKDAGAQEEPETGDRPKEEQTWQSEVENRIGYAFENEGSLRQVFIDPSFYEDEISRRLKSVKARAKARNTLTNKELESKGDKLLNTAVKKYVKWISRDHQGRFVPERLQALLSCNLYLSAIGFKFGLDRFVLRKRWTNPPKAAKSASGEKIPRSEEEISTRIIANAMEALIAAIKEDNKEGKGKQNLNAFIRRHILRVSIEETDPFFKNFCALASPKFEDVEEALAFLTKGDAQLCTEQTVGPLTKEGHPPAPYVYIRYRSVSESKNDAEETIFDQTQPYPGKRPGTSKIPAAFSGPDSVPYKMALAFLSTHPWYMWYMWGIGGPTLLRGRVDPDPDLALPLELVSDAPVVVQPSNIEEVERPSEG